MYNPMRDPAVLLAWSETLNHERVTFGEFITRDDIIGILETSKDPADLAAEVMVRTLSDADFDLLLAGQDPAFSFDPPFVD